MIAITPFTVESLGFTFPNACVTVKNVTSDENLIYNEKNPVEGEPDIQTNTIVQIKVYADKQAYLDNKQPVSNEVVRIAITPADKGVIDNILLNLAFPESNIEAE